MSFLRFAHQRPLLAPEPQPILESFWLGALAALGAGFFVGTFMIGPALSSDPVRQVTLHTEQMERRAIDTANARPDPFPYRTPTPDFGPPGPAYGKFAREAARAALSARAEVRPVSGDPYADAALSGGDEAGAWRPAWPPQREASRHRYRHVDRASNPANF